MTLVGDLVTGQPVGFRRWRQLLEDTALQEGVLGAGDLKVGQRAASANMSVDVAAGQAWVNVDTGALNGLSHATSDAVENRAVTASNGTNPRLDQVILRYNDTSIPTGSGNAPTVEVLAGTATAGATLDTRTGAAALPADAIRLADVLVPAASASVTAANIRDRRLWARGAHRIIERIVSNYTTASGTLVEIDGTNFRPRIECSGAPIRFAVYGTLQHSAAGGFVGISPAVDGNSIGTQTDVFQWNAPAATNSTPLAIVYPWNAPPPGSHLLSFRWRASGGTATILGTATNPAVLVIEEIVRQNADNT